MIGNMIDLAERGWLPDWLIRKGIRRLLAKRLKLTGSVPEEDPAVINHLVEQLRESPLAINTAEANEQHYEVPAEFFQLVLGPYLKYSCCYYSSSESDLKKAEADMLRVTCQRAEIRDGMRILELGCGWGSLTLWMAEQFPNCQITAVSNSHGQRHFIENRCREKGLENVTVITADMREFETDQRFDRVVSVEMFEHMRNYRLLLERISNWLTPQGKLFVHIFCHRHLAYLFETEGSDNWMGRHFFTGGIMPSEDLLLHFQDHVEIEQRWRVSGSHYAATCEAWLQRLDERRDEVTALFEPLVGQSEAALTVQRWRIFFMACAELFDYEAGSQWHVAHYLFRPQSSPAEQSTEQGATTLQSASN